jgi:hypothetical protein
MDFIEKGERENDYSDGLEEGSVISISSPAATPLWRKLSNPLIVAWRVWTTT